MMSSKSRKTIVALFMILGGIWGILSIFITIEYIETGFIESTKGIFVTFPVFCANMFDIALSRLLPKSILQSQPVSLIRDPLLIPLLAIAFGILFGWLAARLILWISNIYVAKLK